ncbi:MAG: hypothetical protein ACRDK2_06775 [Solirubrobacteraceae bacterium]
MTKRRELSPEIRVNLEVICPSIDTDEQRASEDHHRAADGHCGVLHHYPSGNHPCALCSKTDNDSE